MRRRVDYNDKQLQETNKVRRKKKKKKKNGELSEKNATFTVRY